MVAPTIHGMQESFKVQDLRIKLTVKVKMIKIKPIYLS